MATSALRRSMPSASRLVNFGDMSERAILGALSLIDANGEEGNKKEQLQQQHRQRRRNPSALEAAGEQAGQKEDQYEDRNR